MVNTVGNLSGLIRSPRFVKACLITKEYFSNQSRARAVRRPFSLVHGGLDSQTIA